MQQNTGTTLHSSHPAAPPFQNAVSGLNTTITPCHYESRLTNKPSVRAAYDVRRANPPSCTRIIN